MITSNLVAILVETYSKTYPENTYVLQSYLFKNETTKKLAIICHGLLSDSQVPIIQNLADKISSLMNVVVFDFTGCGKSSGIATYSDYEQQIVDLHIVIKHYKTEFDLDLEVLIGHSKGASTLMLYVCDQNCFCVPKIISISGRCNLNDLTLHRFTQQQIEELDTKGEFTYYGNQSTVLVTENDFRWRKQFNIQDTYVPKIKTRILILHGNNDQVVPVDNALCYQEVFKKSSSLVKLELIDDADHFFNDKESFGKLIELILDFI